MSSLLYVIAARIKNWAQVRFILHLVNSINLNPFLKPQYFVSSCI